MVFFTIVIVVKWIIGVETCPLFPDGVAHGNFTTDPDSTVLNQLYTDLMDYNNTILSKAPVYVNGTEAFPAGSISPKCSTDYKNPEDYCNLMPQECDASAFIVNPKVKKKICSHTGNRTRAAGVRIRNPNP